MDGIIFFSNESDHPLARFLKPGFRHCWCAVKDDQGFWTAVDGREGRPGMSMWANPGQSPFVDAVTASAKHCSTWVPVTFGPALRSPILLHTCVAMVKAVFGIRSFAITPHQLYRALLKRGAAESARAENDARLRKEHQAHMVRAALFGDPTEEPTVMAGFFTPGDLAGLGGGSPTPERATAASVPGQAARAISEVVSWQ